MSASQFIINNIGDKQFLTTALKDNLTWIKKSFSVNNNLGSSKYCKLWGSWSDDYPETTGYLLPTIYRSAIFLSDSELKDTVLQQIDYFKDLQLATGGFKIYKSSEESYVFDSAQIMLGLILIYPKLKSPIIFEMINRCYTWLISLINDQGNFKSSNYKAHYNPSYYSRILWPLLLAESLLNEKSKNTLKLYGYLKTLLNTNGTFSNCSFDGTPFSFTHNLIYSYRGLLESAILLNDIKFVNKVEDHLTELSEKIIKTNSFNGEYDELWNIKNSFICSTGNAQLVVLLLSIYKRNNNHRLLNTCQVLIKPLLKQQNKISIFNKGAIPSSIPIWGKYQRFKYTNWTQKFYSDALLDMIALLDDNQH